MNVVRLALVGVSLALLPGCASLALVQGPQPAGHPDREASSMTCTTSKQWIAVDGAAGILLGLTAVAALADSDGFEDWVPRLKAGWTAAVGGVLAGFAGWSARSGNTKVNDCRALRLQVGVSQQAPPYAWRSTSRANRAAMGELSVPEIGDLAVPSVLRASDRRAGPN